VTGQRSTRRGALRRLAIILPPAVAVFMASWILIDRVVPLGGCSVSQLLTGDSAAMTVDCTPSALLGSLLHGLAGLLIAVLLVIWPLRALIEHVEAKERGRK
jgi:chromate transport protein ChrA